MLIKIVRGCEKWIPDKILHRYDDPIFFSTFIFSSKKIVLKIETRIFQFPNEILLELKQDFIEDFIGNLLKSGKKHIFIFKMIFFDEKIKVGNFF